MLTACPSAAQYVDLKQHTVWLIDARASMLVEANATDQVRVRGSKFSISELEAAETVQSQ